ncbi:hypothetical protein HF325_002321 [Metschnikowia pulcherrima]|uniref:Uncharacterized protein n=1 Tax=Metschnikowia pulcherrima TaxID=27326 RepID=A0A8H7GUV1_9ASCO|nr:hypothetical protein HF325_002321 [Metschnikowia pulcherrima]
MFTLLDLREETYNNGWILVHVIAFKPIPGKNVYHVSVTDYTTQNSAPIPVVDNRLILGEDEKAMLKIKFELFLELADAYSKKAQQDLFRAEDVNAETSAWIDISRSYCFAIMKVSLEVNQMPFVRKCDLLEYTSFQFPLLWERFANAHFGRVLLDKPLLLRLLNNCLTSEQRSVLEDAPGDSTSYSTEESQVGVKAESSVMIDDSQEQQHVIQQQEQFLESLQREPGRRSTFSRHELLTQVPIFANESQKSQESQPGQNTQTPGLLAQFSPLPLQPYADSQIFEDTLRLRPINSEMSLEEIYAAQEAGTILPLAALKQVPAEVDHRTYTVKAHIVGTFPDDLMYVCTKRYDLYKDGPELSDPAVNAIELLLLDEIAGTAAQQDSVWVHVPKDQVLMFFGCRHVEQLYTQMPAMKAEFAKLYSSAITVEVVRARYAGRPVMWVLKDVSRMSVLSNELV